MTWKEAMKLLAEAFYASYSPFSRYPEDATRNE